MSVETEDTEEYQAEEHRCDEIPQRTHLSLAAVIISAKNL